MNYTTLTQMLIDWPENRSLEYVTDLPEMIGMAEVKLQTDLNLGIFDVTDTTQTLATGARFVAKPAGLIQLNAVRLALITATNAVAAVPTGLILPITAPTDVATMTLTGAQGPAPVTLNPARQVAVQTLSGGNGIVVTITGIDVNGYPTVETITSSVVSTTLGDTRFARIDSITMQGGASGNSIQVGTAAVAANTFGKSWQVDVRSKEFCDSFNSDPTVVGRPRYFNEYSPTEWEFVNAADQTYGVLLYFIKRPPSIVDVGNTWLGDNCGELLFAATLMEAERFIKADDRWADIQTDYQTKLATRKGELYESIRTGRYAPMRPEAAAAE